MRIERLVEMANDIGNFFEADADEELAVRGIAQHLRRFWDPRMREAIMAHARAGGEGLSPRVLAAVLRLCSESNGQRLHGT